MTKHISKEEADLFLRDARFDLVKGFKLEEEKKETVSESKNDKEDEESDELVCPLCQHELSEELSDEAILEHTANILAVLDGVGEVLNESDEDESDDEDLEEDEIDEDESDDEDLEEDETEADEDEE